MLSLQELSNDRFMNFVRIAEEECAKYAADHSVEEKRRVTFVEVWKTLLNQLRQDPRYEAGHKTQIA